MAGMQEVMRYSEELLDQRFKREVFNCPLRTLSDVMKENDIAQVDFLKIDAQKSEFDVIQGIHESDWGKIKQIVMEVHDLGDRLSGIITMLKSHGFKLTIEQDDLYEGSLLYNLYARRAESPLDTRINARQGQLTESSLQQIRHRAEKHLKAQNRQVRLKR